MLAHHTAVRSMFLIASHYGTHMRPEQLASVDIADPLGSVLRILSQCGFKCRTLRGRGWKDMASLGSAYPVMAVQKTGNWVIVACITTDQGAEVAAVVDPSAEQAGMTLVPRADFLSAWSGTLVLCKRRRRILEPTPRFGLRWFMPEILRHRRSFRDVTIAALASNIIGLSTPLMYNVIIDKVISHQSYETLLTIVLMFLAATAFDGIFSYVRQRMMLFATNKIDAKLASRTFARLLSLPLTFFEHTTAGVLTRHMQQTEKLRHFLTGRLFQTMLDTATLPILIVLLAIYSVKLTLVVMACALAMAAVIAGLIPTFRTCLNRLYQAEGDRQGHLVETIHGMRTIKSLGMETLRQDEWDSKVVNSVRRHAVVGKIGILGSVLTGAIEKIMQISVLGLGTLDVFSNNLTIGALVAFTMLSGRMSGPLVQIVALINEFQETALSVKMLGTVMDHPPERDPGHHSIRAAITGELEFDQVTFRHPGSSSPALDRVSFRVAEGQVVGVVGRSGSGKTTLTRLMQGIQTAQEGAVRLSGIDIRHIDLSHLRHEVGIVLQDSFLFRGTIRDNIAATRPDISLAEIVAAARTAGAEEFIDRLPLSYETMIEEGATNLSGGQRQRIAIARALLAQPRLLIFDEATSALDPESEGILQANLKDIARNKTMVIVSHRLSSLVQADAILVLDHGQAIDFAPHDMLVERCPIYRNLWNQQTQHIRA